MIDDYIFDLWTARIKKTTPPRAVDFLSPISFLLFGSDVFTVTHRAPIWWSNFIYFQGGRFLSRLEKNLKILVHEILQTRHRPLHVQELTLSESSL